MNAVRGVLRDLVERKLWPVAVLLLAAAIAVPVYLGRSSGDGDSPPVVADQPAGGKISRAAVKLDPSTDADSIGSVRNPFKQQHVPKSDSATTSGDASTPSGGGATPSTGSGSGSDGSQPPVSPTGSGGGSGSDKPASKPETDKLDLYHLTVRVGRADGKLKTLEDVARLSPLPSVTDPFMVYTGVLSDGKTAVFLLSSDAKATGDGTCKPSTDDCESVEVKKGDTEFFDLNVDGQAVQYELDVVDVTRESASGSTTTTGTAASADSGSASARVASAQRHSNAGAGLLRKAHVDGTHAYKNADAYRWLPHRGVLVRTPKHGSAQASFTGAVAASSADAAATLPGQPVWHWQLGD
jgi:hypothetical protein